MPYNYSKLIGRIIERYGSQSAFSRAVCLSERALSLKLNGKLGWKQQEIAKCCELLFIDPSEIATYFFDLKVQNN